MSPRNFTKAVTAEVAARCKPLELTFGPLQVGDEVKVTGRKGLWRFLSAEVVEGVPVAVNVLGPLGDRQMLRSLRPETVQVPSTRALNKQRKVRS